MFWQNIYYINKENPFIFFRTYNKQTELWESNRLSLKSFRELLWQQWDRWKHWCTHTQKPTQTIPTTKQNLKNKDFHRRTDFIPQISRPGCFRTWTAGTWSLDPNKTCFEIPPCEQKWSNKSQWITCLVCNFYSVLNKGGKNVLLVL